MSQRSIFSLHIPRSIQCKLLAVDELAKKSSQVISCYLDASEGESATREAINKQLKVLQNAGRLGDADTTQRVKESIDRLLVNLNSRTGSQALFMAFDKPLGAGMVIDVDQVYGSRVTVDSLPDIRPLLLRMDRLANAVVVAGVDGCAQVIDVQMGLLKPSAWAQLPVSRSKRNHPYDSLEPAVGYRQLQRALRRLSRQRDKPIIVAANNDQLFEFKALVSGLLDREIKQTLPIPAGLPRDGLLVFLREYLGSVNQSRRISEEQLATRQQRGEATMGARAALKLIAAGRAECLLVSLEQDHHTEFQCHLCGAYTEPDRATSVCAHCGVYAMSRLHTVLEACWLAFRSGIPVVHSPTQGLQGDGIGCLVRPQPTTVDYRSIVARQPPPTVDLVA